MTSTGSTWVGGVLAGVALVAAAAGGSSMAATPLDEYVNRPDPNAGFRVVNSVRGDGGTAYLLTFSSQAWRTGKDVDRILWRHWLEVYVPDRVRHSTALLWITGGSKDNEPPKLPNGTVAEMALSTGSVTACLRDVPNQPLVFMADPELRRRSEDEILAFAFARFVESKDATWIALLPMVKSAVGAMDAITEFCGALEEHPATVSTFVVTGASKRGWTTWLAAAVDKRVVGAAPVVIDMLNTRLSMQHQYRAYGAFAEAVHDYVENGVMDSIGTAEFDQSMQYVDPYLYRERLTMPKLILNSTGDQFFLPDSWRFYWKDMPGPMCMRTIPNTDHGLNDNALETLRTFYQSVLEEKPMPRFKWDVPAPGRIVVRPEDKPLQVRRWWTTNPEARDFRLETIGEAWKQESLAPAGDGTYVAEQPEPPKGWSAFLVELVFPDPCRPGKTVTLTSGVSVVPDRLPYDLPE